jgi:hypothetical protein
MGRGLATKTLAIIEEAAAILAEIQPATVRGVAYKLFTRGVIPNMSKSSVSKVSRSLVTAREQEMIPWHWIVDEHREIERRAAWSDPGAYARTVKNAYRRDRWQDQDIRLLIVSEKGTVRGLLQPVLEEYGVGFLVCHGFASATVVNDLAELSLDDDRPLVLLYVGDFDPSGRHMSDADLPDRIDRYGGDLTIDRIALTEVDIRRLPSFSAATKRGDPRYRWYVERFGDRCWELDAMDPNDLRAKVERAILDEIDWDTWDRATATEKAELASLNEVLTTWQAMPVFLTGNQNTSGAPP